MNTVEKMAAIWDVPSRSEVVVKRWGFDGLFSVRLDSNTETIVNLGTLSRLVALAEAEITDYLTTENEDDQRATA